VTSSYNPDHTGVGAFLESDDLLRVVESVAELIRARAISMAPVGTMAEQDDHPGLYISSFRTKSQRFSGATGDRVEAVVYNDAIDAVWVEFGHHGREPFHVLLRAAVEVRLLCMF
jgi:hypothetical protein